MSAWWIYHIGKGVWIAIDDPELKHYRQENELNAIRAAQDIIDGKTTFEKLFPRKLWPEADDHSDPSTTPAPSQVHRYRRRGATPDAPCTKPMPSTHPLHP